MEIQQLQELIFKEFGNFPRPQHILKDLSPDSFQGTSIINDFGNVTKEELTYDLYMAMIFDSSLLTDEAILYFLPVLISFAINKNCQYHFFYNRLKLVNRTLLSEVQSELIDVVINMLQLLEQEFDEM